MGPRCFVRPTVGAGLLIVALLPAGLVAQIPGGRSVNFDGERAAFRAVVLNQIRPVMESWQGAWRGDVGPSVESFYAPDAVIAVRDSLMGGSGAIAEFARAARRDVGALAPSMLDFDASDMLAYVYGAWSATPGTGGAPATGRLVTVLRKGAEGWMIRFQLFSADSAVAGSFRAVEQAEPLPSVERRVAVGSRAFEPAGAGGRERQDSRSVQRIGVYRELIATMASLRRAWAADDTEALTALLRDGAWLRVPGAGDWAGRVTPGDLDRVLPEYGPLYTAELDFEHGGTMAYLSGRYWAERSSAPPLSGSYTAVFQNLGSGWQIRFLALF
jgi:ketosteroid isomerase-like protein